jgi:preprotein translocase subunit SecF
MRALRNVHIKFMKWRKIYFLVSGIMIVASLYSLITHGLNYGIDFSGGTQVILKYKDPVRPETLNEVRSKLTSLDLGDVIVHDYGTKDKDGNVYSLLARVELSTEESMEGKKSIETGGDIAELIANELKNDQDKASEQSGKKDINSFGKLKLENYLAGFKFAPEKLPAYVDNFIVVSDDEKGLITDNQKYSRFLADQIVAYRERADVGIFRSFEQLKEINKSSDLVAANNNQPVNIITDELINRLRQDFYLSSFTVIGVEMVGPSVGADLRDAAIASIVSAIIGILIYITIRFKFRFGVAAVIALIHDVTITTGIFSLSGKEFTLPIVAALLTIVGYSLNDTIVVSDRIRENLNKLRRDSYSEVIDISINDTLSRTILTSLTTLFVVICLLFLGGEVLNGFAFALFIGIIVGTYSSICIVSPILVIWQNFSEKYQKREKGSQYVKRSIKTMFPEQRNDKKETSKEGKVADETHSEVSTKQAPKRRSKKGITGKKHKKRRK